MNLLKNSKELLLFDSIKAFRNTYNCPYTVSFTENLDVVINWSSLWFPSHNQTLPFRYKWRENHYLEILVKNVDL